MGVVIGIDVGGSTTKIVGIENKTVKSPMFVKATDPVTSLFGAFGKYIYDNGITLSEIEMVMLTGVGSAYIDQPLYGLPTAKADEFMANGLGARYAIPQENLIVVSMGTGTSFVKVEGQQILYNGRELTVRGIVKEPQNIMLCQSAANDETASGTQTGSNGKQQTGSSENNQQEICYDKISLLYTDKSKAINRTAAEFISRYGLDGQILHYEYKRNLCWFTDLIPGKWSDFSGWKENLKTLQSDEKILKQCEKSTVESLYLEWIWKRNNCFLMCLVMAELL